MDAAEAVAAETALADPVAVAAAVADYVPVEGGPSPVRTTSAGLTDVLLLGVLSMFGSVAMDMYLPALPRLARDLRASPDKAQATISVFLIGLALGQLVYGPLSDRWGRRRPVLLGVGVYLAASAALALARSIDAMIAARLLQALGACAGMVISRAVVRDRYDDQDVLFVYSLLSLVFGVAPVVAPLIGGWILAVADWRWIFGVQALFGFAVGLWTLFGLVESRSEPTRERAHLEPAWRSYLALLRQPRLSGALLTGSLSGAALFAYITAAPEVVITILHVPAAHFGWVFGVNSVGLIGANQINARLAPRFGGDRLLRTSLHALIAFAVVLAVCAYTRFGGVWGVLVPLFFVISTLGFTQSNTMAAAMIVDRHRAGSTAALLGAAAFGVGGLAGGALGLLHDGTARPMALVILGSAVLASLSLHLIMERAGGAGEASL